MIAQIEGKLTDIDGNSCLVQVGHICYEVLLAGYAVNELSGRLGQDVVLCTMEYFEGSPGGGNLVPRLIGFLSRAERAFFMQYTSVKGMGIRKGLKSLAVPISTIANAIEAGDQKMLMVLPGVGRRFSQLIIAELQGKLGDFAIDAAGPGASAGVRFDMFQTEALEILIAWGEKRTEAMDLVSLACQRHPDIKTSEELVPLIYRIKQGVEV